MRKISVEELCKMLEERNPGEMIELKDCEFQNMDLCGWNLSDIDFSLSSFFDVRLDGCNFQRCKFENALLDGNSLAGADFRNASLKGCCMRSCDMTDCDLRGADLFSSVLEKAKKDGWKTDDETKWYKLHCPEEGAFVGYKKCIGDRIVQLLIPADAKRTSATLPTCRCSKAKVLCIKNFEETKEFEEAWSMVDENFVYRKGQWVEVLDFNEDRWMDSTTGIHFWMSRREAMGY